MTKPQPQKKPLTDQEFDVIYAEEGLVTDTMELIAGRMQDLGISKADLARKLGVSPANITQMLRGRNISLRTLARTVHMLGGACKVSLRDWTVQDSHNPPKSTDVPSDKLE